MFTGRDERECVRGTWLGINCSGRISNLLTITVPMHQMKRDSVSRGRT